MMLGTPGMRIGGGVFSSSNRFSGIGGRFNTGPSWGFQSIKRDKKKKMPTEMQWSKVREAPDYKHSEDSANTSSGTIRTSEGTYGITEGTSPFTNAINKAKKRRGEGNSNASILG